MRKVWFPALLVAVLIIITIAYIRLVFVMSQNRSPYDALPEGTSVIFQFNHAREAFEKFGGSSFYPYLKEAPFFRKMERELGRIDTLMKRCSGDSTFSTW